MAADGALLSSLWPSATSLWLEGAAALQPQQQRLTLMVLLLATLSWLWWLRRGASRDLSRIPGPRGLPLVGVGLHLAYNMPHVHNTLLRWHEQYGPLVRLRVLWRDVVLVADPAVAARVYGRGAAEVGAVPRRTPETTTFDVAHGMGKISPIHTEQNEERWRAIRRGIAPAYTLSAARDTFPDVVAAFGAVCERVGAAADAAAAAEAEAAAGAAAGAKTTQHQHGGGGSVPGEVCVDDEVFAGTIEYFCGGMLRMPRERGGGGGSGGGGSGSRKKGGADARADTDAVADTDPVADAGGDGGGGGLLDAQGRSKVAVRGIDAHVAARAATEITNITTTFLGAGAPKMWAYLALPWLCEESRRFHALRRSLMDTTARIAAHVEKQRPAADGDISLAACLSRICEPESSGRGGGEPLSRAALQAEAFLELVGQGSVTWTMAWALFLMTQHPDAERRAVDELRAAGFACDGDVAAAAALLATRGPEAVRDLPFVTAVLHEAMRLYPTGVTASPRITEGVTRVGPYSVPAGVCVYPNLFCLLNYSGLWGDDALEFKPERWDAPHAANDPKFVPFGMGTKACPAQHTGMLQSKAMLALLLSCFSWRLAPRMGSAASVLDKCIATLELRVRGGMWLVPRRRQPL